MAEINLLDKYPRSSRPIDERGGVNSEAVKKIARKYGVEYFDGERIYGYGGYNYDGKYWSETVIRFRDHYQLHYNAKVLDVGCAKGFMMFDFKRFLPGIQIYGLDISRYALEHAKPEMAAHITRGDCQRIPWDDNHFDLVISINTVHNLPRLQCIRALSEIQRVTKGDCFITVDAWRNEEERQRLLNWMLTAYTYYHVDDWVTLFKEAKYNGDYYWFFP